MIATWDKGNIRKKWERLGFNKAKLFISNFRFILGKSQ